MASDKIWLSHSGIQIFKNCKRRFKYKYIDKIQAKQRVVNKYLSFGQSVHKTLAEYNAFKYEQNRTLSNLKQTLRNNWIRDGYQSLIEEKMFGERALDMLENYYREPLDTGLQVLALETNVNMDYDSEIVLCGKIDKVFLREDGLVETLDYKTSATVKCSENPINDLQLPIYTLLTHNKIGKYPALVSYYYLMPNKKQDVNIDDLMIEQFRFALDAAILEIKEESEFSYSPTIYCSSSCEFADICEGPNDTEALITYEYKRIHDARKIDTVF